MVVDYAAWWNARNSAVADRLGLPMMQNAGSTPVGISGPQKVKTVEDIDAEIEAAKAAGKPEAVERLELEKNALVSKTAKPAVEPTIAPAATQNGGMGKSTADPFTEPYVDYDLMEDPNQGA